jgi:hypothetical protein
MKSLVKVFLTFWGLILFCHIFLGSCHHADDSHYKPVKSMEKYWELRTAKLNKSRALIHNNDGCEALYFPINEKYTADNFLSKRTAGLTGTDVSTISYCTQCSGFGHFTYHTKVGEIFVNQGFNFEAFQEDKRNIMAEMLAEGTDPLQITIEFARENGFEIFWSTRINDTHDRVHSVDKPYLTWTKFKENHPQYLFGKIGEVLPYSFTFFRIFLISFLSLSYTKTFSK